jgi:hypothetical protein
MIIVDKTIRCKHTNRKYYARGLCKSCYRALQTKWYNAKSVPINRFADCHTDKRHYGHGLCRQCWKLKYKYDNPERFSEYKKRLLVLNYGNILEERQKALIKQRGECAICKRVVKLVTDHDHKTGKFRGLLCNPCNSGLGFFRDSPDNLISAKQYLEARIGV